MKYEHDDIIIDVTDDYRHVHKSKFKKKNKDLLKTEESLLTKINFLNTMIQLILFTNFLIIISILYILFRIL